MRGASTGLCQLGLGFGGLSGSSGGASGLRFRSKVISDMLVVLFIGGRGLFPNNIFFFFLVLLLRLANTDAAAFCWFSSVPGTGKEKKGVRGKVGEGV